MKKQRTKKATVGEKVVDWFCESVHEGNVFNDAPNDRENGRSGQSLARRIDSAIAAERRRGDRRVLEERERCAKIVEGSSLLNSEESRHIANQIRSGK